MPFVDLMDPITAHAPERTIGLEEDVRFQNANAAAQIVERPTVELDDTSLVGSNLIILHSDLGECLAPSLVGSERTPVGRVTASTLSVEAQTSRTSTSASTTSPVYRTPRGEAVIIARVAPERAVAWSSAVYAALRPASVFVVCGIAGYNFRGTIDAESTEENIFCLHINTNTDKDELSTGARLLPGANLIDGLGAAMLLHAEMEGVQASAVIAIELTRSPREELVRSIGEVLFSLLEGRSLTPEESLAIKKACATKYAASADLSVYA